MLRKVSNITILQDFVEGPFEHSFNCECYQKKLKDILNEFDILPSLKEGDS